MKIKNFSDEMLQKYVSSEVSIIEEKHNDKKFWRKNEDFHSQITIRMEEDNDNVSANSDG